MYVSIVGRVAHSQPEKLIYSFKRCWVSDLFIDLLAQLVEQYTFNVWVVGSNPTGVTNTSVAQLVERRSPKPKVVGSIPT